MSLFERSLGRKKQDPPFTWEPTVPVHKVAQDYVDEDGRRRRSDVPYLLPKDEQERQRLDYQHALLRQILAHNCFAPVHELLCRGGKVLDVGCGTGKWGHEIATAYPQTQVSGFDLEEVVCSTPTPPNYQFHQGNVLSGLPFTSHTFHYVHQRLLVAAIPLDTWPWVVQELSRVTAPQGWVELVEMGNTFHRAGPATQRFLAWWSAISASRGIDASYMCQLGTLLKGAGLCNVRVDTKRLAVGKWGGRIGNLLAQDLLAGWPSMRPLAHTLLGVPPAAFNEVMGQLEAEWNSYHTTYELHLACGQA